MKKVLIILISILSIFIVSCQKDRPLDKTIDIKEDKEIEIQDEDKILLSNMSDDESIKEVESILKSHLEDNNVDAFIKGVSEYNEIIEKTGLTGSFESKEQPVYDSNKIYELWSSKKGDFIGTNCRLNTFLLLKDDIKIKKGAIDDSLLFLDKDSLKTENIFNKEETEQFKQLFSRVKTTNTTDINTTDIYVHAKNMEDHFSNITFDNHAKMISVILHDNLDGDYLFVGHAGVLAENKGKYLFVEKLSFEEPFQAIKFDRKEDCYKYLFSKYENYHDETTVKPFIMENGKLVESELYDRI